jgi:hypothetical protein
MHLKLAECVKEVETAKGMDVDNSLCANIEKKEM